MNYADYQTARDTAWKCLADCHISSLPIKLSLICRHYGIEIIKNSDLSDSSSFKLRRNERATVIPEKKIIIIDDTESLPAQRYSVAHEIGHLLCGSLNEYTAERFAISLLAPACVLWGCRITDANEIASICNVSITAAEIRAKRMAVLYERNKFLTSPLEQKVYNNFKEFIDNYRNE